MAFHDHKYWIRLSQKTLKKTNDFQKYSDILQSGLGFLKTNVCILYNFACASEHSGNYEKALRFFKYC